MCNRACLAFVERHLQRDEILGKRVIESGSRDVNGSVRGMIEALGCLQYVGTDIALGKGVDVICDAVDLVKMFDEESFDVLVSTEVIEHVEDWRRVISNYKRVLKPGGVLYITTRSEGFIWHGYPYDYWRYEVSDMQDIFEDFVILHLTSDPSEPGVFIKAWKPLDFKEKDLSEIALFSSNLLVRTLG